MAKYDPDTHDGIVYRLRLLGLTHERIAETLGIGDNTLRNWRRENESLRKHYDDGGLQADAEVAEALFKRATGFTHKEDRAFVIDGEIHHEELDKVVVGDVSAQKHWLARRSPESWHDKQSVDVNHSVQTIDPSKLSTNTLRELLASRIADESESK